MHLWFLESGISDRQRESCDSPRSATLLFDYYSLFHLIVFQALYVKCTFRYALLEFNEIDYHYRWVVGYHLIPRLSDFQKSNDKYIIDSEWRSAAWNTICKQCWCSLTKRLLILKFGDMLLISIMNSTICKESVRNSYFKR